MGERQRHGDLAVLLLAQLAAVLAGGANPGRALLWKARVVADPGSAQAVSLEGRQYLLTHGGKHGCVAPRCCGDEVMQCLVQTGHVGRVEAGGPPLPPPSPPPRRPARGEGTTTR